MKDRLEKFLRIGFGREARIEQAGGHRSKSRDLPILRAEANSPFSVENFSDNYHFHFLGLKLKEGWSLPATFMFPISGTFNSYALSGHVTERIELTNFQQLYFNRANMPERFGMDVGTDINAAMVIRFLLAAYSLNQKAIEDVVFNGTRYGCRNFIDANAIDFDKLTYALDFHGEAKAYDYQLSCAGQSTFSSVTLDRFDLNYGGSRVEFELNEGSYLPTLPLPRGTLYVQAIDTVLADHIPSLSTPQYTPPYEGNRVQEYLPASALGYQQKFQHETYPVRESLPYDINHIYSIVRPGSRKFSIHCSNVLDAAMVGMFLVKAVGPVVDALMAEQQVAAAE